MRAYLSTLLLALLPLTIRAAIVPLIETVPEEDTAAVLHNPDMGWVLYENYPLDQSPGSATLRVLPEETFPEVDAVAIMLVGRISSSAKALTTSRERTSPTTTGARAARASSSG